MYSILFSSMETGVDIALDRLKGIVSNCKKVVVLPWAFPKEINAKLLENDFFKKDGKRYNRYINSLKKLGINEENIIIGNCYSDSKKYLRKIIKESDLLLLPGGNPEMFFKKVVHDTELLYDIKYYKGIIIGESAGTELQLKRYFITAKNNYYKYFAFYDGFGVLNDPFYIDVHSIDKKYYLEKLKKVSKETNKIVYAIFNDGLVVYNRNTNEIETYGNVKVITPKKSDELQSIK